MSQIGSPIRWKMTSPPVSLLGLPRLPAFAGRSARGAGITLAVTLADATILPVCALQLALQRRDPVEPFGVAPLQRLFCLFQIEDAVLEPSHTLGQFALATAGRWQAED